MNGLEQNELYRIIGTNIKYFRKLYNLEVGKMTQENLAELVDVSTALIGNLESDKIPQGISVYTLYKISKVLDTPIEKFFEVQPTRNKKPTIHISNEQTKIKNNQSI